MKVLIIACVLFVAVQANPQFRALRARASGLGGGSSPQATSGLVAPQPAAAPQPQFQQPTNFGRPLQYQQPSSSFQQPMYQQYQAQPQ
ncbi:hypothetical protein TNCT_449761 [Trichonephila clavata]|uniref:Uncharacterized protein n=1 Tax=Trichonephila clavata TaxID=2740835 RepID=A0A8X6M4A6_TRICU|nr:hypothetical protein TNCT_449761 [Trichonephila clavata]